MEHFDFLDRIMRNLVERPGRNAFYIRETWYTYGELAALTAGIQDLVSKSGDRGAHLGIYLADDIHTYASIMALWLSGKSFSPINPQFPQARNRMIIDQLQLGSILYSKQGGTEQLFPECKSIFTGDLEMKGGVPQLAEFSRGKDAYVLFTSGSTGIPKGVRISAANLNAFVRDFIGYPSYDFTPDDRFLQMYDLSFDGSVPCYAVPLAVGASVFTVPVEGIKYLAAYKLILEQKLTFVKMTPSTLSYLRPYFSSIRLPDVKYCLFGGEAFPSVLAGEWETCVPNALVQNVYGPTEAAIISLIYDWNGSRNQKKECRGIVSIGKVTGSNRIMVVGEDGQAVPPGETGELLIAGDQVSPGYWNDPVLNERAFVNIETDEGSCRFYRTGDLVSVDAGGDVMYIGRNDQQVQVRGYRVELGEIESVARGYLKGPNVMAWGREEGTGEMEIFLAVESAEMDLEPLRDHLEEHLPSYMLPSRIVATPHFPRLVSGKLDRKAFQNLQPS